MKSKKQRKTVTNLFSKLRHKKRSSFDNIPVEFADIKVSDVTKEDNATDISLEDFGLSSETQSDNVSSVDKDKEIYDLQQMIEISKSLCSVIEYSKLVEAVLFNCMCQMRVTGACIFIQSFDSDVFSLEDNYTGIETLDSIQYKISENHPVLKFLNKKNQAFTLGELNSTFTEGEIPIQITSLNPTLIVPLQHQNRINGILLLGERIDLGEGIEYTDYDRKQILSIAALSSIAINNATLVEMTTTDMMTHLKLKHYFYKVLTEKLDFSIVNKLPLSVLMLDIDFFKKFNDTYGHACGDYVIQKVAQNISEGIRSEDLPGRYGGEEFVAMLYNTDITAAQMVAERIRKNIEQSVFEYDGITMQVTISIGVATFDPEKCNITAKQLVEMADQALYISKRNGRNKVTLADDEILQCVLESKG